MDFLVKPWAHQLTAIERAKSLPYFALFFEMGAGKTGTAINILRAKMTPMGRYVKTLILCPPIVVPNWADEFAMHSKIPRDRVVLLQGSAKERLKTFNEHAYQDDTPRPVFFVTNYESLLLGGFKEKTGKKRYIEGELFQAMYKWAPEAVICDESHRLKNYKAQRSQLVQKLANPVDPKTKAPLRKPWTYLLSGSPVLNSPMDLFYQFLIMDGGETFGKNFFVFRARFFEDKNKDMPKERYFPNWVVKSGAVEQINELIFKFGMRVTKDECLDLPEETSITIKCKMGPLQTRNYKELKRDFITTVESKTASVTLAIVKALRLMQVTSGFLSLDGEGDEQDRAKAVYEECEKEQHLEHLLEELTPGSKVIVWAVWKENYAIIRRVCERLNVRFVEVHGGISRAQQNENVTRFKTDESVRVFIGHPGSGGIGINLTCAPYSIFYSRTFSLEHWLQARARNHRGGQTEKVTHYDLVCEGTIDELVQNKLAGKLDMSESLLKDISHSVREQAL